ncbi:MAG: patatin-like phospholipase family protein [candidate division Zixibacteria bacterium]|nr:patatin-like phospholipase family protein [candidate division Zixibacteria bacterium]
MALSENNRRIPGKIGLALGGGSARGWAHIGVIHALTEAGIDIDYIAGTSIGSVVGSVFASGNIRDLEEVAVQLDWKRIAYLFDVVLPKSGLIDGKKVAGFVQNHLRKTNIEELPIPFCAVSTDLNTGEEVVIGEGDIIDAVRASISIPGIFTPVKNNGRILVDGGLVNPVPVSVVREMGADFIIAVDLSYGLVGVDRFVQDSTSELDTSYSTNDNQQHTKKKNRILEALNNKLAAIDFSALSWTKQNSDVEPLPSIFDVITSSINIMEVQIAATRLEADPPDILIQPNLSHIKFLEFNRASDAISVGCEETKRQLDALLEKGK